MLAHKRQRIGLYAFLLDVIGATFLFTFTYWFLDNHGALWQDLLQQLTGYPFEIQSVSHLQGEWWFFVIVNALLLLAFQLSGVYRFDYHSNITQVILTSFKAVIGALGLIALSIYFLNLTQVNRSLIFLFVLSFWGYFIVKTFGWNALLRYREGRGHPHVLILVGPQKWLESVAEGWANLIRRNVVINGYVCTDDSTLAHIGNLSSLGIPENLNRVLVNKPVDSVCLYPESDPKIANRVWESIEETGVEVWYFLPQGVSRQGTLRPDSFLDQPFLMVSPTPDYQKWFWLKSLFDRLVAAVLLLVLSPLFIALALAIRWKTPGKIIYKQTRTGFKGRPFTIYKFRTMKERAEHEKLGELNQIKGPVYKAKNDPRITPLGKWMRRFSLDELPQLWNVLNGTMSLVGPRPLPIEETQAFPAFKDHRRYRVLPGITGLWQVSGRASLEHFEDWIRLDLQYIDEWSFWLDLKILMKTLPVVLHGKGAG